MTFRRLLVRTRFLRAVVCSPLVLFGACASDWDVYDPRLVVGSKLLAGGSNAGGGQASGGAVAGVAGSRIDSSAGSGGILIGVAGSRSGGNGSGESGSSGNASSGGGGSSASRSCGNGTQEDALGEECDDGNTANGDGCSRDCVVECSVDSAEIFKKDPVSHICYAVTRIDTPIVADNAILVCAGFGKGFALATICDAGTKSFVQDTFARIPTFLVGLKQPRLRPARDADWYWLDGSSLASCPITPFWAVGSPDDGSTDPVNDTAEFSRQDCARWVPTSEGIFDTGCADAWPALCTRTPARLALK